MIFYRNAQSGVRTLIRIHYTKKGRGPTFQKDFQISQLIRTKGLCRIGPQQAQCGSTPKSNARHVEVSSVQRGCSTNIQAIHFLPAKAHISDHFGNVYFSYKYTI